MRYESPEDLLRRLQQQVVAQGQLIEQLRQASNQHRETLVRMTQGAASGDARAYYEGVSRYSSVVLGIGYAGFFGLWSLLSEASHHFPKLHAVAALSMGISLMVFVLWEVFNMITSVIALQARSNRIGPDSWFARKMTSWHDATPKLWKWQIVPAVLSALVGAACLASALFYNVYCSGWGCDVNHAASLSAWRSV